jgi:hypothetical protein
MKSILLSVIAIVCCAVPATLLSWWAWSQAGLSGLWLSLATVFSSMLLAVALFVALIAIGRALKIVK